MSSHDRRTAARRRAWGRGPMILRFEPLEVRDLKAASIAAAGPLPDLVGTAFSTVGSADYGQTIQVSGSIANIGNASVPPGALAGIYASSSNSIGVNSALLGIVVIPAGLPPGGTEPFSQAITLPPSPLAGTNAAQTIWIGMDIDPQGLIPEVSKANNENQGLGLDQSLVAVTAAPPANLIGKAFGISPNIAGWGGTFNVTAQVENNAQGAAPATRAKIVLTPANTAPGGPGDITVGNIAVPALAPFQTVNLVQSVTLPATPPTGILGPGTYYLSMIQDADHLTDSVAQQAPMQGLGLDETYLTIPTPDAPTQAAIAAAAAAPLPDLAATGVIAPTTPLNWGGSYPISTSVQNVGAGVAPAFNVEFLLTNTNGSTGQGIYLGSTTVPAGLATGQTQVVAQTIKLPNRLPYGLSIGSTSYAKIVAVIDPENMVNESFKSNNQADSAPLTLRLLGGGPNATVPTYPPIRPYAPPASPPPPPTVPIGLRTKAGQKLVIAKIKAGQQGTAGAIRDQVIAQRRANLAAYYLRNHAKLQNAKDINTATTLGITTLKVLSPV